MEDKEIIKELIGKKVILGGGAEDIGGKSEDEIKSITKGQLRKDSYKLRLKDNLISLFLDKKDLVKLSEGKVVDGITNTIQIKETSQEKVAKKSGEMYHKLKDAAKEAYPENRNQTSRKKFLKVEDNYYSRAIDAGLKEVFSSRKENRKENIKDAMLKSLSKDGYNPTEGGDDINKLVLICIRLTQD